MQVRPAPRQRDEKPRRGEQPIEHLLRRAGFGASRQELDDYSDLGFCAAVRRLVNYEAVPDDVDSLIGQPGYVADHGPRRVPAPDEHHRRPPALAVPHGPHAPPAPGEDDALLAQPLRHGVHQDRRRVRRRGSHARTWRRSRTRIRSSVKGQIELLREFALGNFRDLLIAIAKDLAMLVWLDGRTNVKGRPQENFARELMELFTMGVGTFAEADVYAGRARVHRLEPDAARRTRTTRSTTRRAARHDAKDFTFPIYANGEHGIPARAADAGMQDGIDLIDAVARHPETGPRLARKLYGFFVSEVDPPDEGLISELCRHLLRQRLRDEAGRRAAAAVAGSSRDPVESVRALFLARGVRRPRAQGSRLGRVLGQRRADADGRTWGSSSSSRRT